MESSQDEDGGDDEGDDHAGDAGPRSDGEEQEATRVVEDSTKPSKGSKKDKKSKKVRCALCVVRCWLPQQYHMRSTWEYTVGLNNK